MTFYQATLQTDVYKQNHRKMYHPDVTEVYSNFTSRNGKYAADNELGGAVNVGLQGATMFIMDQWKETFFNQPKAEVCDYHSRIMSHINGTHYPVEHLEALHDLGYLPVHIKTVAEGTIVPYGVPSFTIVSTNPEFSWVTNMLETCISAENWMTQTSATTAANFKLNFMKAKSVPKDLIPFLGHDFSYRGMPGVHAAAMSGFGHLTSFYGTDTIPAVPYAVRYYQADLDVDTIGCSVPATEHSVMCSWQSEGEIDTIRYLMKEFPEGFLSIVADTWDFWKLVTEYLPTLKDEIMVRPGKVVIRPDSGDPVKIICGYSLLDIQEESFTGTDEDIANLGYDGVISYGKAFAFEGGKRVALNDAERKGLIECLWDIFGGIEYEGFKYLDEHIGAIYGDSITLARQKEIIKRLEAKGLAASNVVLGIGSYSYQMVSRDTHGSAVKATSIVKNGKREAIFKDPKTDPGKKSAKGLLYVYQDEAGTIRVQDNVTEEKEACESNMLQTIWKDGFFTNSVSLSEVRSRIDEQLEALV